MRPRNGLLLNLEETALLLGIGRSTLYRAVNDGKVPFPVHRIGGYWYVPKASLERFLAGELEREEETLVQIASGTDLSRPERCASESAKSEPSGSMPADGHRAEIRCARPPSDPHS